MPTNDERCEELLHHALATQSEDGAGDDLEGLTQWVIDDLLIDTDYMPDASVQKCVQYLYTLAFRAGYDAAQEQENKPPDDDYEDAAIHQW